MSIRGSGRLLIPLAACGALILAAPAAASAAATYANQPKADLAITNTVLPGEVEVGQKFTYTLTVTDNGPHGDNHVHVTDRLPEGGVFKLVHPGRGYCYGWQDTVSCSLGSMPHGSTTKIMITVKGVHVGHQTDVATGSGAVRDNDLGNNQASTTVRVVRKPTIAIRGVGPACDAQGATVEITATARAEAGIGRVIVRFGGHTVRTYISEKQGPTDKTLRVRIRGTWLRAGRTYPINAGVVDVFGGHAHTSGRLTTCQANRHVGGFTG